MENNEKRTFEIEFEKYISNYDASNPNIALKIKHQYEVKEIARQIATRLCLNVQDREKAEFLGLFHDIGRFEQFAQYGTFVDAKSVDHGDFGARILSKDGYIKKVFPGQSDEDYEILIAAVKYHNKYILIPNMPHSDHYFCKIIRDADKIDIYRAISEENVKSLFFNLEPSSAIISDEIKEYFYRCETVPKSKLKTRADGLVLQLAFCFDFNYNISKKLLLHYGYLDNFVKAFLSANNVKDTAIASEVMEMYDYLLQYLDS